MNLKESFKNEIFRASIILLLLTTLANILNYVLHLVMGGWLLKTADYGTYGFLISLIYIFGVPAAAIQTLVARHTIKFNVKKEYGRIKGMIKFMFVEASILALLLFVLFCLASLLLSNYFHISFGLLCITGLFLFGAFLSPIGLGVLQGLKKFSALGWNLTFNSTVKLMMAIVLVLLGFRVYGAITGFLFGVFFSVIFVFPYIKEIMNSQEIKQKIPIISRENLGLLSAILIITLMYSMDIIISKIFFSADLAGKYTIASMIGKMIFFGTSAVAGAMFPISSERFLTQNKEKSLSIIKKSFFIISALCLIALIFLGFFPKMIIQILFRKEYLEIENIMFYIGVAFSFISLTNAWILYKLSTYEFRIRHALILLVFLFLQIASFIIFHENLTSFSIAFMISTAITFIGSVLLIKQWKN